MALDTSNIPELTKMPPDSGEQQKQVITLIESVDNTNQKINSLLEDNNDMQKEASKQMKESSESIIESRKESFKAFEKIGSKFSEIGNNIVDKNKEIITTGLLGPISLLTKPLEDFAGFSIADTLGNALKPKRSKIKPTANDVARDGDSGILFLWNKLKGYLGKEDEEGSLLDKLGNMDGFASLVPALLKGGAVMAIAGGVIWAVIDGIRASAMADEWGTSKANAVIGGVLGGTGSGWNNAFKNAGKYALIGAGTGFLIGGPIGAIAGGLIGAAIGLVVGYIGGEAIAQRLQQTQDELDSIWESETLNGVEKVSASAMSIQSTMQDGVAGFFEATTEMVTSIFTKDQDKIDRAGEITRKVFDVLFKYGNPAFYIEKIFEGVDKIKEIVKEVKGRDFLKKFIGKTTAFFLTSYENFTDAITNGNILKKIGKGIRDAIQPQIMDWIQSKFMNGNLFQGENDNSMGNIGNQIFSGITNWFVGILGMNREDVETSGFWTTLWTDTTDWIDEKIIQPLKDFFLMIGDFFAGFQELGVGGVTKGLIEGTLFDQLGDIQSKREYEREQLERFNAPVSVNDAIIKPDGSIIRTAPDDTIIATKNEPNMNPTMMGDDRIFRMMLDTLNKLLAETTAIKNKPTNNGESNGGGISNNTLEQMSTGRLY